MATVFHASPHGRLIEIKSKGRRKERYRTNKQWWIGKHIRVVLVPCHAWKCLLTAFPGGLDISEVPGCYLLRQKTFQWGSQKLLQWLVSQELTAYLSVFDLFLNQWIMAILSKGCKPDNFKSQNSLKLSFANIRRLHSDFVECESSLESNSPDIIALCQTNLEDSIDSGNFSVRGYLPLVWKDSITHMHGLCSLCERRTFFCMGLISRKLYGFLLMFSTSFLSLSLSLLLPLLITFFVIMHGFWFNFI